ncbi:MAG: LysE family translocator [Rhodospirillales bacterium]|nr:LysE family translocator [Rhodospirillales bacterium]
MSPEFLITSLIVVIAPGSGVIYTLTIGLGRGGTASLIAAFGCTLGILPHMAAAILGLAAVLHTSALAFQIFKYAGLAYLLYLAWTTLQDKNPLIMTAHSAETWGSRISDGPAILIKGVLVNILNPKLSIFFLAFLPQFIAPVSENVAMDMAGLSLVFMAMTWLVFSLYGLCAASVRRHLIDRPQAMVWLRRVFAGAFAGLGLKLAFSQTN